MRDLYRILEACQQKKYMTRLAFFPGGHITLGIYNSEEQSRQYMYESKTGDIAAIEVAVKKDFPRLLTPTLPSIPSMLSIPSPLGFPKP